MGCCSFSQNTEDKTEVKTEIQIDIKEGEGFSSNHTACHSKCLSKDFTDDTTRFSNANGSNLDFVPDLYPTVRLPGLSPIEEIELFSMILPESSSLDSIESWKLFHEANDI